MPDPIAPYIPRNPRDLITAEDWNEVQVLVQKDFAKHIDDAIKALTTVPKSADSAKLAGKTPEELAADIINKALQELNKRTGYMRVFRNLAPNTDSVVKHGLKDFPVTDVYGLAPFSVVCSESDTKVQHDVLFYLYHSSEKTIKTKVDSSPGSPQVATMVTVTVEHAGDTAYRILFSRMLELYRVQYDDDTSLDDLVTDFWKAFFAAPNEEFGDDTQCHSPWFDRCCGDKRTVGELKRRGDWDDLWFQTRPVKTINLTPADDTTDKRITRPSHVRVEQHDFDTLVVSYRPPPVVGAAGPVPPLPVMLLLKV